MGELELREVCGTEEGGEAVCEQRDADGDQMSACGRHQREDVASPKVCEALHLFVVFGEGVDPRGGCGDGDREEELEAGEGEGPALREGGVELLGGVVCAEGVGWGEGHEHVGEAEGEDGAEGEGEKGEGVG